MLQKLLRTLHNSPSRSRHQLSVWYAHERARRGSTDTSADSPLPILPYITTSTVICTCTMRTSLGTRGSRQGRTKSSPRLQTHSSLRATSGNSASCMLRSRNVSLVTL